MKRRGTDPSDKKRFPRLAGRSLANMRDIFRDPTIKCCVQRQARGTVELWYALSKFGVFVLLADVHSDIHYCAWRARTRSQAVVGVIRYVISFACITWCHQDS